MQKLHILNHSRFFLSNAYDGEYCAGMVGITRRRYLPWGQLPKKEMRLYRSCPVRLSRIARPLTLSVQFAPVPPKRHRCLMSRWYVIRFHGVTSLICGCGFPPHNAGFPARFRRVYYIGSPPSSRLFRHRIYLLGFFPPHSNNPDSTIFDGDDLHPLAFCKRPLNRGNFRLIKFDGFFHKQLYHRIQNCQ